jgi:hypothetical protein
MEVDLKENERSEKIGQKIDTDFGPEKGMISVRSLDIKTLDDALKIAKVDLDVWEVERYVVNSWEVTVGAKGTGTDQPETYTNFQVKVWLKRKHTPAIEIALNIIADKIQKYAPDYRPVKYTKKIEPHLLEPSFYDIHLGKLAWAAEVGHDYDVDIASRIFSDATDDIIRKVQPFGIEKILFVIGNDFFHVNNPKGVTPKGANPLDVDGRMAKVYVAGEEAVVRSIEKFRQIAPVKVLWVPGNHDPDTSFFLLRTINAQFYKDECVEVDCSPAWRKYELYGKCLIGFTHGDEEKERDLPRIMADEVPELWAQAKYKEIHRGHLHRRKQMDFISADSFGGTTVRTIPSMGGTDQWHFMKGYTNTDRAAQAFLWNKETGLAGILETHVKPENMESKVQY